MTILMSLMNGAGKSYQKINNRFPLSPCLSQASGNDKGILCQTAIISIQLKSKKRKLMYVMNVLKRGIAGCIYALARPAAVPIAAISHQINMPPNITTVPNTLLLYPPSPAKPGRGAMMMKCF